MANVTLMQDWITIQTSGASTVIQNEEQWLDMADFLDLSIQISTQNISGTSPVLSFKTSPSKDEALFQTMSSATFALTSSSNPAPVVVKYASAAVPLARYVRWELSGTGVTATFRIYVAGTTQGAILR